MKPKKSSIKVELSWFFEYVLKANSSLLSRSKEKAILILLIFLFLLFWKLRKCILIELLSFKVFNYLSFSLNCFILILLNFWIHLIFSNTLEEVCMNLEYHVNIYIKLLKVPLYIFFLHYLFQKLLLSLQSSKHILLKREKTLTFYINLIYTFTWIFLILPILLS